MIGKNFEAANKNAKTSVAYWSLHCKAFLHFFLNGRIQSCQTGD